MFDTPIQAAGVQLTRRAQICAVGSSFVRLIPDIAPHYKRIADIQVLDRIFDDALTEAEAMVKAGTVDVFVAAGANGAFLRERLRAPVVLLRISGFDFLQALTQAREVSDRIAVFSYEAISAELEQVKQLLKLEIEQCFYTTPESAAERVRQLAAAGYKVVVGSNMVKRLADAAGLTGVLIYSSASVRQALDDAVEIARLTHLEESRREWLHSVLRHLDEAVVAVDRDERIQSLNPPMARLLGVSVDWALGRRLSELSPDLSLEGTLRAGAPELGQVQKLGTQTLIVNRLPVHEHGVQTGAVLTCQDARAIERADRHLRTRERKRSLVARYHLPQLLGDSPTIAQVRTLAAQYAHTEATVLITGESGTGKELLAQGIHNESRRREQPFVAVNCGAFPETLLEGELFGHEEGAFTGSRRGGRPGLFEAAHRGTIFLDEIGEMPAPLQSRLLRVLQEKEVLRLGSTDPTPVDVRVIAATNCDLRARVAAGKFREDLYYRLNILRLHVPPLRERIEDLVAITRHLLTGALQRHGAADRDEALNELLLPYFQRYLWPGNVREMENVIERVAAVASALDAGQDMDARQLVSIVPELFDVTHGEPQAAEADDLHAVGRTLELEHIRRVVQECGGDQREAARRLGISRTTLWRRLNARN